MQTLAIVSKSTKQGLSVWRFVSTDNGEYFAFGGCKPACKAFKTLAQMRACYKQWLRYGYEPGLPSETVAPKPVKKQLLVADPWESQLPLPLQLELASL